jgi:transposase InsO family protein
VTQVTLNTPTTSYLRAGHFLYWRGQQYRLLAGDSSDHLLLHLEDLATGARSAVRVDELFHVSENEEEPLFAASLTQLQTELAHRFPSPVPVATVSLPASLLKKASHIISVVENVTHLATATEEQNVVVGHTVAIRQACAHLSDPIHLSTYYRYRDLYLRYGGDQGQIAAALRRSTFNQSRMDKAQLHFVDTLVMRYYARSHSLRLRPLTVYRIGQSTLQRTNGLWLDPACCGSNIPENLLEELLDSRIPFQAILDNPEKKRLLKPITLPSRGWFYQYLRWFERQPGLGKAVFTARYGREKWEQEHLVFDTFASRAALPLQYVFADHWLLDVFTVDEATRSRLDRLWLTVLLDAYSRSVLGMTLAYEAPCVETIQSALRHAIWPKISHQELGIKEEWACFGIPQQLFLDNAWSHRAYSLQNLVRVIGQGGRYATIDLVFRPPYKGRYGALVERFFGNLSGQVKELLPGALRGGDVRSRRQAGQEACLLYQDIYRLLHQIILAYQHTPHHELGGLTPHEKWTEGREWGMPLVPTLTPSVARLFWRMNPKARVITGKGVCAFDLHYWSPTLSDMERIGPDGRPTLYHFSYQPDDISRLALFHDGHWVGDVDARELRLPDGSTMTLSLWEQKMAQAMARQAGGSTRDWLAYVHEIDALSQKRLEEKKQQHRLQARPSVNRTKAHPDSAEKIAAAVVGNETTPDYTDLLAGFAGGKKEVAS